MSINFKTLQSDPKELLRFCRDSRDLLRQNLEIREKCLHIFQTQCGEGKLSGYHRFKLLSHCLSFIIGDSFQEALQSMEEETVKNPTAKNLARVQKITRCLKENEFLRIFLTGPYPFKEDVASSEGESFRFHWDEEGELHVVLYDFTDEMATMIQSLKPNALHFGSPRVLSKMVESRRTFDFVEEIDLEVAQEAKIESLKEVFPHIKVCFAGASEIELPFIVFDPSLSDQKKLDLSKYGEVLSDKILLKIVRKLSSQKPILCNLEGCKYLTDAAVIKLAETFPSLGAINLAYCERLTDRSVEGIAQSCQGLRGGIFHGCNFTDAALTALTTRYKFLQKVFLHGCKRITEGGILEMARHCRKLDRIEVDSLSESAHSQIKEILPKCVITGKREGDNEDSRPSKKRKIDFFRNSAVTKI